MARWARQTAGRFRSVGAGTAEAVDTATEGLPFDNLAFADGGTVYFSSFATASLTERAPDGTVRTLPLGT